jgi:hypothetical protein
VRYSGTAEDGPFEQHDLSAFCASEDHAVKVGTYILARRKHITHTLAITVRPDAFNETLAPGDLIRVRLERTPSTGASSLHNELYEVDRIGKSLSGEVQLELTQFPVDDQLRSVVALEVNAAVGNGVLLPTGKTGVSCDVNSSADTSVPADTGTNFNPGFSKGAYEVETEEAASEELEDMPVDNPDSDIEDTPSSDLTTPAEIPREGDQVSAPTICAGGRVTWYRLDPSAPGGKSFLTQGTSTYTMVINDVDYSVYAEVECPDPASPTGYGPAIPLGQTGRIYPAPALPGGNVYGTYSPTGTTTYTVKAGNRFSSRRYPPFGTCTIEYNTGTEFSGSVAGLKAFRLVKTSFSNACGGGYAQMALEIQNAAGTWFNVASIAGGPFVYIDWVGSIELSSSAPDAIPAYLGNFGGTSNPP